ncbi:DUF1289 domain-containing protein [Methylomonas rapida]|uniref:DUF1289 domain-containing protein n=1 Tax=Methylomonas rapida TaxID=2963939 RepID=A0ABY7GJI7_9GAMM|nr:DUF1289 domain-containing protein [Methylomonas rapida]WAR44729.1 DUF1289 domain-containing protein [Methylomonas rapida]
MAEPEKNVASPCVRNCCLNDENICLGCFRSLEEICQWSQAGDIARRQVLRNAEQRRRQYANRAVRNV